MTPALVKTVQRSLNKFTGKYLRGVKPLRVDGVLGHGTRVRIESVKYYLGFGASRHAPDSRVTPLFLRALESPKSLRLGVRVLAAGARRRRAQRKPPAASGWDPRYAGCRTVTNEIIRIVGERAPVTSRKRWQTFGNPTSDHYAGNERADAVDFDTANNHELKNEISRRLGGPAALPDYGSFGIVRNGVSFRVQIIAGTHGTGPHLHAGVRRV